MPLLLNLLLLAGQAGFGKQAALYQQGLAIHNFWANPYYLLTMACLGLQVMVWPLVLRYHPLGFAYGVSSLNLVATLAISAGIFGETVTWANAAGCVFIVSGVWVWGTSKSAGLSI